MAEKTFAELLQQSSDESRTADSMLNERLKALADEIASRNPEFTAVVERMIARLQANGVGQTAPDIGDPMPDFFLPDESGALVRLETLLEQGPVVVSFHRGH